MSSSYGRVVLSCPGKGVLMSCLTTCRILIGYCCYGSGDEDSGSLKVTPWITRQAHRTAARSPVGCVASADCVGAAAVRHTKLVQWLPSLALFSTTSTILLCWRSYLDHARSAQRARADNKTRDRYWHRQLAQRRLAVACPLLFYAPENPYIISSHLNRCYASHCCFFVHFCCPYCFMLPLQSSSS